MPPKPLPRNLEQQLKLDAKRIKVQQAMVGIGESAKKILEAKTLISTEEGKLRKLFEENPETRRIISATFPNCVVKIVKEEDSEEDDEDKKLLLPPKQAKEEKSLKRKEASGKSAVKQDSVRTRMEKKMNKDGKILEEAKPGDEVKTKQSEASIGKND
jgi:hypothetical protein